MGQEEPRIKPVTAINLSFHTWPYLLLSLSPVCNLESKEMRKMGKENGGKLEGDTLFFYHQIR